MKWTAAEHQFMSRALQLARKGLYSTQPNPRVGCVMVKQERIIAEGWHEVAGREHAEIRALQQAGTDAEDSDCYITLEPCSHTGLTSPCTDALIKARVRRVVAAMEDPNSKVSGSGMKALDEAGIKIETGLMSDEAAALNPGFIKRMSHGMPYVRCKLAMSLDGKTALANGRSKWITGSAARMDVQTLRAQSSAILTGIGTVLADDPQLNVREIDAVKRQPMRVIIDRGLRCPVTARILGAGGRTLIFTARQNRQQMELEKAGAEVHVVEGPDQDFLSVVLSHLALHEEINEVLLEAGAGLAGSMLSQRLIDEIILYQAPLLLGDSAKGLFHLPAIQDMDDKIELDIFDRRMLGKDLRISAKVKSR